MTRKPVSNKWAFNTQDVILNVENGDVFVVLGTDTSGNPNMVDHYPRHGERVTSYIKVMNWPVQVLACDKYAWYVKGEFKTEPITL